MLDLTLEHLLHGVKNNPDATQANKTRLGYPHGLSFTVDRGQDQQDRGAAGKMLLSPGLLS